MSFLQSTLTNMTGEQPIDSHWLKILLERRAYGEVRAYLDYHSLVSPTADRYLQLADAILTQDLTHITTLAPSLQYDYLLHVHSLTLRAYCYQHYQQIRWQQQQFADWLRSLSPGLVDLMRLAVERHIIPQLDEFLIPVRKDNGHGKEIYRGWAWNQQRIEATSNIIHQTFKENYGDQFNYGHYLSSSHLIKLIMSHSQNDALKTACQQLRNVEKMARNLAAHESVHVDATFITERTGYSLDVIHSAIQTLMEAAGLTSSAMLGVLTQINHDLLQTILTNKGSDPV